MSFFDLLALRRRYGREGTETSTFVQAECSVTVTSTVAIVAALLLGGSISATVDTTTDITAHQLFLHSVATDNVVDVTTAIDAVVAGTQLAEVVHAVDTSVTIAPGILTPASLTSSVDATTSLDASLFHGASVSATVDTTASATGTYLQHGSITNSVDVTTAIEATTFKSAECAVTVDTSTTIDALTFIGAAVNATVDTVVTASPDSVWGAAVAAVVDTTVVATAYQAPYYELQAWGVDLYRVDYEDTPLAATVNTMPAICPNSRFILRVAVGETAGTTEPGDFDIRLQYRVNSGTWSEELLLIFSDDSLLGNYNYYLAQKLTTNTPYLGGSFLDSIPAYKDKESTITTFYPLSNEYREFAWALQVLVNQDVGDVFDFRVQFTTGGSSGTWVDPDYVVAAMSFTVAAPIARDVTQTAFRLRNADGDEATSTWKAALNTDASFDMDKPFKARFLIDQEATTRAPTIDTSTFNLEYSVPGKSYFGHPTTYDGTPTGTYEDWMGNSIAISGNGNVVIMGAPGWSQSIYRDFFYIYRWNATTEVYDFEFTANPNELGLVGASWWNGSNVELNYAGDRAFISNSNMEFRTQTMDRITVLDYSGGTWSMTAEITRVSGMASDYVGRSIHSNAAGDVIYTCSSNYATSHARYVESPANTWTGTLFSNLGMTEQNLDLGVNPHASPDLTHFVSTYGRKYTWGGTAFTEDTDDVTAYVNGTKNPVWFNDAFDEMMITSAVSTWYQGDVGIATYDLDANYVRTRTQAMPLDIVEWPDSRQHNSGSTYYRWDATDDGNTIVMCNHMSETSTESRYANNNLYVYRRTSGGFVRITDGSGEIGYTRDLNDTGYIPITQQISTGGVYVPSQTSPGLSFAKWPSSGTARTELEWTLQLNSELLANNDTVDLRVVEYNQHPDNAELTTYDNIPTITALNKPIPVVIEAYRGRDDDDTEAAATWQAATNTTFNPIANTPYRLRYEVSKAEATAGTEDFHLQYNIGEEQLIPGSIKHTGRGWWNGYITSAGISDDASVVVGGNRYYDTPSTNCGAIYISKWNSTTHQYDVGTPYAPFNYANAQVGKHCSVAGNGKWVVVSSHGDSDGFPDPQIYSVNIEGSPYNGDATSVTEGYDDIDSVVTNYDCTKTVTKRSNQLDTWGDGTAGDLTLISTFPISGSTRIDMTPDGKILIGSGGLGFAVAIWHWNPEELNWARQPDTPVEDPPGYNYEWWGSSYEIVIRHDGKGMWQTGSTNSHYTVSSTSSESWSGNNCIWYWEMENAGEPTQEWVYKGVVAYTSGALQMSSNNTYMLLGDGVWERDYLWRDVEDDGHATAPIRFDDSSHVTDGQVTTQQLGSGTFVAGDVAESQWPSTPWTATANQNTEHEYVLQNTATRFNLYDPIRFRVIRANGVVLPYNYQPELYSQIIFPELYQRDFRSRNDDGYEATASWYDAKNTDWDDTINVTRRLRFAIENVNVPSLSMPRDYELLYNYNNDGRFWYNEYQIDGGVWDEVRCGISRDGMVMAHGNYSNNLVSIWDKQADSTWVQRGSDITEPNYHSGCDFGTAVALNSDGTVLYVGAAGHNNGVSANQGRVYRYTWSGSAWSLDSQIITADWLHTGYGPNTGDRFGTSVSCSGADDSLVIGAPNYTNGTYADAGIVFFFQKVGGTWYDGGVYALPYADWNFGYSCVLSEDGLRVAMGAPGYSSDTGAVFFLVKEEGVWTLRNYGRTGAEVGMKYGTSVAMDRDGRKLLIGAPFGDNGSTLDTGVIFIYDYDGTNTVDALTLIQQLYGWSTNIKLGWAVSISSDSSAGVASIVQATIRMGIDPTWEKVGSRTDTTKPVRYKNTTWVTDKEATTQQISTDTNFDAGEMASLDYAGTVFTDAGVTELEYVLDFYDLGTTVSSDIIKFKLQDVDYDLRKEMSWQRNDPVAYIYINDVQEAETSITIDTTVQAVSSLTRFGEVGTTVDTVVTASASTQQDLFGEVDITVDTTVTAVAAIEIGAQANLLVRVRVPRPDARVALRGEMDLYFGTRVFNAPVIIAGAEVTADVDTTVVINSLNEVLATLASTVDVINIVNPGIVNPAVVSSVSDCSTTISANIIHPADCKLYCTVEVFPSGGLTFDAKCGIIGACTTNIVATVDKFASLDSQVDVSSTILSELDPYAFISLAVHTYTSASANCIFTDTIDARIQTIVRIEADVIPARQPCGYTAIVQTSNVTDIDLATDTTNILCSGDYS